MVYPMRLALSTLLLLCIGTGRATWIDSVAVIDAVSEPEPSQELENASDGEEPSRPPGLLSAEDSRLAWADWSTQAANRTCAGVELEVCAQRWCSGREREVFYR